MKFKLNKIDSLDCQVHFMTTHHFVFGDHAKSVIYVVVVLVKFRVQVTSVFGNGGLAVEVKGKGSGYPQAWIQGLTDRLFIGDSNLLFR